MSAFLLCIYLAIFLMVFPFRYSMVIVSVLITITSIYSVVKFSVSSHKRKEFLNPVVLFMSVWLIWSLITYYWIANFDLWVLYNWYLYIGVAFSVTFSYAFSNKNFWRMFSRALVLFSAVHVIIGMFELLTGVYLFTNNAAIIPLYTSLRYPVSFFYNTNDYALFLLFSITVLLNVIKEDFDASVWLVLYKLKTILIISIIILIYFSASRTVLGAAIIAIFMESYFKIEKNFLKNILLFIVFVIIIVLFIPQTVTNNILGRISEDGSGSVRLALIKNSYDILIASDFRGVGAGNVRHYFETYRFPGVGTITAIHNWWMEILVTYGAIFFGIYAIYYIKRMLSVFMYLQHSRSNIMKLSLMWFVVFIPGAIASSNSFDQLWLWFVHPLILVMSYPMENINNTK